MVLKEIFGDGVRIRLLEELIDNWGEWLTVDELSRMADVSSKSVYSHMNDLKKIGFVVEENKGSKKFKLSENNSCAVSLALIQSEEFLRRLDEREVSLNSHKEVTTIKVNYSLDEKIDKKFLSISKYDNYDGFKFTPLSGGKYYGSE